MADIPVTREEKYLAYLTGDYKADVPKPITRQERYLYELCLKGMGGEISPEEIQKAVNDYLDKNPVKPGATTEQAEQIEQNKKDIGSLKESISTKITKFYASNQGNTNLPDSDNGKIMDMVLYGKSEQKQYLGKNLLNTTFSTTTKNGVTCTNNNDGTFTLNGAATANCVFIIINQDALKNAFGANEELRLTGAPKGASKTGYYLQIWKNEPEVIYYDTGEGVTAKKPNASCNVAIMVTNGTVCNNVLFKPMLAVDLTMTYDNFEPYVGGIPSPNPDYPQEIKSVVNPTVKVVGKNLIADGWLKDVVREGCSLTVDGTKMVLNGSAASTMSEYGTYFTLPKGTYTFSAMSDTEININVYVRGFKKDDSTEFTATISETNKSLQFTVGDETDKLVISEGFYGGVTYTNTEIYLQIELGSTPTAYEPYHEQTVTLPYTLNAIPVSSGGNVTIDGQQYVSDYVDVERGKLVRYVKVLKLDGTENWRLQSINSNGITNLYLDVSEYHVDVGLSNKLILQTTGIDVTTTEGFVINKTQRLFIRIKKSRGISTVSEFKNFLANEHIFIYLGLNTPEEIDLTPEEIQALKALATYYPTTNISVNSEQLDGYTVFNYPISMANGWNYVKKQLNDNRDYIYDMDLQSAEAYVNSEYAVTLTELEV